MAHFLRDSARGLALLLALGWHSTQAQTTSPTATQETFDTGTKADYTTGPVTLSTGSWIFSDALLGSDAADHKNGTQAARLEGTGRLTTGFYLPDGASTVTVQHAAYGVDASSSWELYAQSQGCNCDKWTKVGATVLTTGPTLQTATFTVNIPGAVKFEVRKTSGGLARLDIDDFTVAPYSAATTPPGTGTGADNDNLAMGNPSGATPDPGMPNNYLLVKTQYVVGYNNSQGKPNWVSWHLDQGDRGSAGRQDNFRNDPSLPAGFYQVQGTSYQGSGFDRGHNCPSADRTSTDENNAATFFMTNMMPQAPRNNQGPWADLENYTRSFLPSYEAYIVCGSYGKGGTGSNGYAETIDQGRVTVPNRTWKVIVLLPVGNNDLSRVGTTGTRVIAVNMPNDNGLNPDWGTFRTSVDAIEAATGYDLLSNLPVSVQATIESQVDTGPTTSSSTTTN
jgi:endonuclease G